MNFLGLITDKRICAFILVLWVSILCGLFVGFGGYKNNDYIKFSYGPSRDLMFLGMPIDTWYRWTVFIFIASIDTLVHTWAVDMVQPWVVNTIWDHKTIYLPYPKWQCMSIVIALSIFLALHMLYMIYLSFTQADIIFARITIDLTFTFCSHSVMIKDKIYDPLMVDLKSYKRQKRKDHYLSGKKMLISSRVESNGKRKQEEEESEIEIEMVSIDGKEENDDDENREI
jgi:hypothetical protein